MPKITKCIQMQSWWLVYECLWLTTIIMYNIYISLSFYIYIYIYIYINTYSTVAYCRSLWPLACPVFSTALAASASTSFPDVMTWCQGSTIKLGSFVNWSLVDLWALVDHWSLVDLCWSLEWFEFWRHVEFLSDLFRSSAHHLPGEEANPFISIYIFL